MNKKGRVKLIPTAAIFIAMLFVCADYGEGSSDDMIFTYTMVDVNNTVQGDAHLIETPGGENVLIDTGKARECKDNLIPLLRTKNIRKIDHLIISHIHADHYEGIQSIIEAGIEIRALYYDTVEDADLREICESECCCNYEHFMSQIKGVKVKDLDKGQLIHISNDVKLNVVDVWRRGDSLRDINDTSALIRLETNHYTILFTGDLNKGRSNRLTDENAILADILKIPHHGAEGLASNKFINSVNAQTYLIPSPKYLWKSDRSKRVRDLMEGKERKGKEGKGREGKGREHYVNGYHGNVVVEGYHQRYKIKTGE